MSHNLIKEPKTSSVQNKINVSKQKHLTKLSQ